jgi:hypothetical protein
MYYYAESNFLKLKQEKEQKCNAGDVEPASF